MDQVCNTRTRLHPEENGAGDGEFYKLSDVSLATPSFVADNTDADRTRKQHDVMYVRETLIGCEVVENAIGSLWREKKKIGVCGQCLWIRHRQHNSNSVVV